MASALFMTCNLCIQILSVSPKVNSNGHFTSSQSSVHSRLVQLGICPRGAAGCTGAKVTSRCSVYL